MSEKVFEAFRDSLCDAAIKVVAEEGLASLTLRRLANEVGCSRQTPYRYFQSKDELIEEVYVRCHDVFIRYCENAVADVTDPRVKLRNIRDAYMRFFRDEPQVYKVLMDSKPPRQMPRVAERGMYEHRRLRSFFDEAIDAGFLEGDSGALAYVFWSTIDGLARLQSRDVDSAVIDANKISDLIETMFFPPENVSVEDRRRAEH